jgi:tetratricopeptide (TPR) repeat protein
MAVELTPSSHLSRALRLNNLGASLQTRFAELGNLADIDNAIAQIEEAVDLTRDDHPFKPRHLSNLGSVLGTRFQRLGNSLDIDNAVMKQYAAVDIAPDDHPEKPRLLTNLGNSLLARFQGLRNPDDIDNAIIQHRLAVDLTPKDQPDRLGFLNNLAVSLNLRFKNFGNIEDINNSIAKQRESINSTPCGHPERAKSLSNLGSFLLARFQRLENPTDIEDAITSHQDAVNLVPDGHPYQSHYLNNLGNSLHIRFSRLHRHEDAEASIVCLSASAGSPVGFPMIRFIAAERWISIASLINHNTLLAAYECALRIMPLVAWLGLPVVGRHQFLMRIGGIARDAAAAAISQERYDKAIEWLDQGRSIVWTQILHLRTPVDELRDVNSDLAERLLRVSRSLDRGLEEDTVSGNRNLRSMELEGRRYRALTAEWESMVEQVRLLPTFENFLKPYTASQLMSAAKGGPVVVLNIAEERCDALALVSGIDEILHIPLPDINLERIAELHNDLKDLLSTSGVRMKVERAAKKVVDGNDEEDCGHVLAHLWKGLVKPVLDALACSVRTTSLINHNSLIMHFPVSSRQPPAHLVVHDWSACFPSDTRGWNIRLGFK